MIPKVRNKSTGIIVRCGDELAERLVSENQYEYPNVEKPKKRGRPPKNSQPEVTEEE